ncbi:hypothetical protein BDV12DRAFT_191507 [Aspergillus spectabilis]
MATTQTNADLDENHAVNVHVVGCVFTGLAIATVWLKITARQMVKRLGWDDFFIIFSLGLNVIAAAFVSYSVTLGPGRHTATPIADHGIVFLIFLQCTPTAALWDHTIKGSCWPESIFNKFSDWVIAYTTTTDIILAIVPISVRIMMGLTLLSAIVTTVKAAYLPLFMDRADPHTTSRQRSGSPYKLSSNQTHPGLKHLPSVSELSLETEHHEHGYNAESKGSAASRDSADKIGDYREGRRDGGK